MTESTDTIREALEQAAQAAAEHAALRRHCIHEGHPAERWTGSCYCGAVQLPRSGWPPTEDEIAP